MGRLMWEGAWSPVSSSEADDDAACRPMRPAALPGAVLRMRRKELGWSQFQLVHAVRREARLRGFHPQDEAALRVSVSRWENDRCVPDELNRRLVCAALEIDLVELGLPIDPGYQKWWTKRVGPKPIG